MRFHTAYAEYLKTLYVGAVDIIFNRELETIFRIRGPDACRSVNRQRYDRRINITCAVRIPRYKGDSP